jgi:hypothetical protein
MKYGKILKSDKIASNMRRGLKQSVRALKKGAMFVKDKTGDMTREGVRQLAALEKKSKESIKKIFKKAA